MFNVGPLELMVVLVIALLVLGPKRLPEMARSVGKGMREFKGALSGGSSRGHEDSLGAIDWNEHGELPEDDFDQFDEERRREERIADEQADFDRVQAEEEERARRSFS